MKIYRKIVTMLLILALIIASLTPFQAKVSKAANYLSAPTLLMDGVWSSDYSITNADNEEETDNDHWYKIVIPSDGKLDLEISSYFYGCAWKLYNNDLTTRLDAGNIDGEETKPKTSKMNWSLTEGVYYLNIYSNYYSGKYKFMTRFTSYGVNDQAAISYVSPLNYQIGSTITGAITETDKADWYKITLPSAGYYSQKIVSYFTCTWKWYNSDLTEEIAYGHVSGEKTTPIAYGHVSGEETTPTTQKNDMFFPKGTYYLKIYSVYYVGKYQFQLNALSPQSCSHDYDSVQHDATYFSRGYTVYHCKKCGHSYQGNYQTVKKLKQGYLYPSYSAGRRKLKISWVTVPDAFGYQIRYSKKKNMKSATVKTVKGQSKSAKTLSKLSQRKKYFVQVRAYKKSGSKTVYGKWSSKRSCWTK